jgi:hypothetical protein
MDNKTLFEEIKTRGLTIGFHVRLNIGEVKEKTGRESFSSSDSLQLTPEAPKIAAQSRCKHPEEQIQVEELFRTAEDQGMDVVAKLKGCPIFMFFPVAGTNKLGLTFLIQDVAMWWCEKASLEWSGKAA